jgi:hypothetical protein
MGPSPAANDMRSQGALAAKPRTERANPKLIAVTALLLRRVNIMGLRQLRARLALKASPDWLPATRAVYFNTSWADDPPTQMVGDERCTCDAQRALNETQ